MHIDLEESAERAFVVSSYAEGFGQVFRSFEAIVGSDIGAREHAKALEAKDDSSFPYHCEIDEVPIGELSRQPGGHRNSEA